MSDSGQGMSSQPIMADDIIAFRRSFEGAQSHLIAMKVRMLNSISPAFMLNNDGTIEPVDNATPEQKATLDMIDDMLAESLRQALDDFLKAYR